MTRYSITVRDKLQKMDNDSQQNADDIFHEQEIVTTLEDRADTLNARYYESVVPYNTDGKIQIPFTTLEECDVSGVSYAAFKQWTFTYRNVPDYWTNGLTPVIVKKYGEDSTGELAETTTLKESFTIGIQEDNTNPLNIVNVLTINVAILALDDNEQIQDDLQVKLELHFKTENITSA